MFFTFSFTLFYLYYLRFCFAFFSNKIARENRHLMKHTCSNSNHFCASCASCARRSLDVTLPRSLQVLVHLILWREIRRTVGCFFKFIRLNRFYFGNFILKKKRAEERFPVDAVDLLQSLVSFELMAHVTTSKLRFLSLILRVDHRGSPPSFRMLFFKAVRHKRCKFWISVV